MSHICSTAKEREETLVERLWYGRTWEQEHKVEQEQFPGKNFNTEEEQKSCKDVSFWISSLTP